MGTKYGSYRQVEDLAKQDAAMESIQSDPYRWGSIQDKRHFQKRRAEIKDKISKITPPSVSAEERKTLMKRQEILEAFIKLEVPAIRKPPMPSKVEMWEGRAGSRGKHRTHENAIKNFTVDDGGNIIKAPDGYGAGLEWKDNQNRLYAEDRQIDPDIASLERLRPQNRDNSSFDDYRRRMFAPTPAFREKYDETFPDHKPTPVEKKISAAKPKKPRKERVVLPDDIRCTFIKKDGTRCRMARAYGSESCMLPSHKAIEPPKEQ